MSEFKEYTQNPVIDLYGDDPLQRRLGRIRSLVPFEEITKDPIEDLYDELEVLKHQMSVMSKNYLKLLQKMENKKTSKKPRMGETVYQQLKNSLEKKYKNKFVALDIKQKTVAGVGNTIDEAYEDAISKGDNTKFYFRKVGQQIPESLI